MTSKNAIQPSELPAPATVVYRFGPCLFLPGRRELRYGDIVVNVPGQEAKVLEKLLLHPHAVVAKLELVTLLWPGDSYGEFDQGIHNLISKLRKLHPNAGRWIVTVPKVGYRFDLDVARDEVSGPGSATRLDEVPAAPSPAAAEATSVAEVLAPIREEGAPSGFGIRPRLWMFGALVLAAAVMAVVWRRARPSAPAPVPPVTVGVLPFSGSAGTMEGADVLREQLDDSLAAMPNVEVRAAHSLTMLSPENIPSAGKQLKLELMIAGTYQVTAGHYALNLELIRSEDGAHLTSLRYEGLSTALGGLPDRIAADLAPLLERGGADSGAQRLLGSTTNREAYELAFRANALLLQRTRPAVEEAVQLYHQTLAIDPHYAKAWAGLSDSEMVLATFGNSPDLTARFEEARRAAQEALALDPGMAQAHSTLGFILFQHDWKLSEAEHQMRLAVTENPGMAANHMRLAVVLSEEGRSAEAEAEIRQAREVDPQWPVVNGTAMFVDITGRRYKQAIADAESLVAASPSWSRAHQHLGWALWYAGKHEAGVKEWRQAALVDGDREEVAVQEKGAALLEQQGVRAYAEYRLAQHPHMPHEEDFVAAEWYAFAGDREHALEALEALVRNHDPESLKIRTNPAYDFLRGDPRFERIVSSMGSVTQF